jgi:hypothetical protein
MQEQEAVRREFLDALGSRYVRGGHDDRMNREEFLPRLASMLTSIMHYSGDHPLIQDSERRYHDFTCRAFMLLSVLHGAYMHRAVVRDVLTDFVGLLGCDLEQYVREHVEYAHTKDPLGAFYPELVRVWSSIESLYAQSSSRLPGTPFEAYCVVLVRGKGNPRAIVYMPEEDLRAHIAGLFKGTVIENVQLTALISSSDNVHSLR